MLNKVPLFDNPPSALRATSPTRGEEDKAKCGKHPTRGEEDRKDVLAGACDREQEKCAARECPCGKHPTRGEEDNPHHQHRTKKLQFLARNMRRHLTLHEVKLWKRLKNKQLGVVFHRQYLIANKYIADFVCLEKKLIIEVDGSQHCDNPQDVKRTEELTQMGFQIIRFWNVEIDRNPGGCAQVIAQKLKE